MKSFEHNALVTGVSSGIGQAIALHLLKKGSRVFGTVRQLSDAKLLQEKGGAAFVPVVLDIREKASLPLAVAKVKDLIGSDPLDLLVNNAGIGLPGPLAMQDLDEIRDIFEVNVFGLLAITQHFLPLMQVSNASRKYTSKIINMSSVAGQISAPFLGAYAASKHAVEGLSHSLRRELMPWNIDVVMVAPGNVQTPIWGKFSTKETYGGTAYSTPFKRFIEFALKGAKTGMQPSEIAEVVGRIAYGSSNKVRYAPVAQRIPNWIMPRLLPSRTIDKMMFSMTGMVKVEERK